MAAAVMGSTATHSMTAMPTSTGTCAGSHLMVAATAAHVVLAAPAAHAGSAAAHMVLAAVDVGLAEPELIRARARAPSADSATVETRAAFPQEGDPALARVVCMAVECAVVVAGTGAEADASSVANYQMSQERTCKS